MGNLVSLCKWGGGGLVSCTINALVSCTSSVRCNSGSQLGGRFPVSVTVHVDDEVMLNVLGCRLTY